jgi:glycine/D-amino acid oxidase-like deaminating enzyme
MKQKIYWSNKDYHPFPKLTGDIECDTLIVGGGITGVSCAYFLRQAKNRVVLIEKESMASGATGASAGILTPAAELDLALTEELLGKSKGLSYWHLLDKVYNDVPKIIKREKIECDFEYADSIYAELKDGSASKVADEYRAYRGGHFRVKFLEHTKLHDHTYSTLFKDAILFHKTISLNPLAFTQNLAQALPKYGINVYEHTPFVKVRGNKAITKEGTIKFSKIIYAMDSYWPTEGIHSVKTTIAVSAPLSQQSLRDMHASHRDILWDSKNDYDYIKFTKDNRLLVGLGEIHFDDKKQARNTLHKQHFEKIQKFVKDVFPHFHVSWDYAWSGVYGVTKNYLPLIKVEGNSIVIGASAGQMISLMMAQQTAHFLQGKKAPLFSSALGLASFNHHS